MSRIIIISGVDGSGKTSIIEGVKAALEADGKRVSYIWMRQNNRLVTLMHAIAKATGLSKKEDTPLGRMWIHYFYKNKLFCWFYIRATYIDNWLARKKPLRFKTDYVICDRWVNDIVIDLASKTHDEFMITGKWYDRFQRLLPKESLQFVIIRDEDSVLRCRVENTFNPAFERRYKLYSLLTKKSSIIRVDNNGPIENSIEQVKQKIVYG